MGQALNLRFLIDEDVPRSTAKILTEAGYDAVDVRDIGLRGKSDIDGVGEGLIHHLAIIEIGRVRLREA